jgi:hypothetical protein
VIGHRGAPILSEVVETVDLKTGRFHSIEAALAVVCCWLMPLPQMTTARAV